MADRLQKILAPYHDVGPLLLRLALGVIFSAHGSQKLLGWFGGGGLPATTQAFAQMGFWPAPLWAFIAALTEFAGGLAVLVGWRTRAAALLLSVVMLMAMFKVHLPNGFFMNFRLTPGVGHGIEYNVALLGGCLALAFGGPGQYAWDHGSRRKKG